MSYLSLENREMAVRHLKEAFDIRLAVLGPENEATVDSQVVSRVYEIVEVIKHSTYLAHACLLWFTRAVGCLGGGRADGLNVLRLRNRFAFGFVGSMLWQDRAFIAD